MIIILPFVITAVVVIATTTIMVAIDGGARDGQAAMERILERILERMSKWARNVKMNAIRTTRKANARRTSLY